MSSKKTHLVILSINGITRMIECPIYYDGNREKVYISMEDLTKYFGYRRGQVLSTNVYRSYMPRNRW